MIVVLAPACSESTCSYCPYRSSTHPPTREPSCSPVSDCIAVPSALWPNVGLVAGSEKTMSREGVRGFRLNVHASDNWGLSAHPSSGVSSLQEHEYEENSCVVFERKMLTSNLYLSNVTLITRLTCLLFGGSFVSYLPPQHHMAFAQRALLPGRGVGVVGLVQGGWMAVVATMETAEALQRLHLSIRAFVRDNVSPDTTVDKDKALAFVTAIAELLLPNQRGRLHQDYRLRAGSCTSISQTLKQTTSYISASMTRQQPTQQPTVTSTYAVASTAPTSAVQHYVSNT